MVVKFQKKQRVPSQCPEIRLQDPVIQGHHFDSNMAIAMIGYCRYP